MEEQNVRKMLNRISAVAVIISISVFLASTKIEHGVVDEDLGFDLRLVITGSGRCQNHNLNH